MRWIKLSHDRILTSEVANYYHYFCKETKREKIVLNFKGGSESRLSFKDEAERKEAMNILDNRLLMYDDARWVPNNLPYRDKG